MKSIAAAEVSSSIVSMRLRVSGPVSSIVCLPTRPQRGCSVGSSTSVALARRTPRGPNMLAEFGVPRIVERLRLLLGVEVVKVAEELVEAVHGRQIFVLVAEVVLAELARRVAKGFERLGDRNVTRLQADRRGGNANLGEAGA